MKTLRTLSLLVALFATAPLFAQNMATKKVQAKYEADYIPEFKSSLAGRSGVAAFGEMAVAIDYASFGDDAAELDLAVRQLNMAKGAILDLARDAAAKDALTQKLKGIRIVKTADASGKKISMDAGTLVLATNSFDLRTLISSSEIKAFLEKSL